METSNRQSLVFIAVCSLLIGTGYIPMTSIIVSGEKLESISGQTYHYDYSIGNPGLPLFGVDVGDNITITITNYTGPSVDIDIETTIRYYYEQSDNWTNYSAQWLGIHPAQSDVLTAWIVIAVDDPILFQSHAKPLGSGTPKYDWKITSVNSKYSWNFIYQTKLDNINNNITSIKSEFQTIYNNITNISNTIGNLNESQDQLITDISGLLLSYSNLNESLSNLILIVNDINGTLSENLSWIEQNITKVKADIYDMQKIISSLPNQMNITEMDNRISRMNDSITEINKTISTIKNTIPNTYNDTILKGRIAQLESNNTQLNSELERVKNLKQEKIIERNPDNSLVIGAIALGILACIISLFVTILFIRKSKNPIVITKTPIIMDNVQPESYEEINMDDKR